MGAQGRGNCWVRIAVVVGVLVWVAASLTGVGQPAAAESSAASSSRIVEHVELEMDDGVVLRGHVVRPGGGTGKVPVVLWSTPYGGSLDADIHDSTTQPVTGRGTVVPVDLLVAEGYAVVQFHVRGTSHSGGCFNLFGRREQADQAALVQWAADQSWSTGRVGMIGQSADAIPALSAAVAAPKSLKTIVVSGIVSDWYTSVFSPQGAVMDDQFWLGAGAWAGGYSAYPPRPSVTDPAEPYAEYATELAAPRYCPEAIEFLSATTTATFDRDRDQYEQFFEDRRWLPKLGRVQAATLLWHGQQEHLAFEDDRVWEALTSAPKWQWLGQWAHDVHPMYNQREHILLPWLDYWLKNEGSRPDTLGGVDYEVNTGTPYNAAGMYGETDPSKLREWRRSRSWPPADAVQTTLHFTGQGLRSGMDRDGSRTFRAMPDTAERHITVDQRTYNDPADGTQSLGYAPPCPGPTDGHTTLVYESEKLEADTVIAGNPIARLQLRSDLPAGSFSVQLFALSSEFQCTNGQPSSYRYLTEGGVNLRFVGDGTGDPWYRVDRYQATPFPTNEQVAVRVDLQSLAKRLPAGYRLAAVFTLGAQKARLAHGHFPKLTVHGSSRLQLPVVEGGFTQ